MCRGCHAFPAVPLRPIGRSPLASFAHDASQHRAPTHRRRPLALAVFAVCASPQHVRPTRRGSTPRVLVGCCGLSRHVAASRRVARPAGHAPALLCSRRSATRSGRSHVAWSGPFGRRSFLGFPSRDHPPTRGRSHVARVTVFASTSFPDGARGVSDDPFAGLLPRASEVVSVSAPSDPRAVCRSLRRSVFAARSAGPVLRSWRPDLVSRSDAPRKRGR